MSKFRYIAIAPGRVDGKHIEKMGTAVWLHDFLIDQQTDAEGRVNYGKPISYRWIRSRFPQSPTVRTLKRWMSRLRTSRYIDARTLPWGQGMVVRILNQKKWPTAVQMHLFPPPDPVFISSGKAVEKLSISDSLMGTHLSPSRGHICPRKALRKELGNKPEQTPASVGCGKGVL